jgi:predicted PurR-regulated permease PerM
MSEHSNRSVIARSDTAALILTPIALFLVLWLHLLPALFSGLLVHALVHVLAPHVIGLRNQPERARIVVMVLIIAIVAGLTALLIGSAYAFFRTGSDSPAGLLQKMAEIIDNARAMLPPWVQEWLPSDTDDLKDRVATWLRTHASEVRTFSGEVGRGFAYTLIGIAIGALVAVREIKPVGHGGPLARAVVGHAAMVEHAFQRVFLAQIRIAALNALLSAIYLAGALPLLGIHLPFTKTMIALTFVMGLLPIVGNLVSNTVVIIISLSYSLPLALGSLAFLVVIHKLEYFVNARIVGTQIKAAAWELLLAMLVMEAAFGIPGVIAAPVFYAYAKAELSVRRLI